MRYPACTGHLELTFTQQSLFENEAARPLAPPAGSFKDALRDFSWDGKTTSILSTIANLEDGPLAVDTYVNEFWTSRQRAAHSLHEISYRACFKPQLPRFFIERLTRPGDTVYDPFMGRGTTMLEAALLGRRPAGCDINPLSRVLIEPRLHPPILEDVNARLSEIDLRTVRETPDDLLAFYHPDTLREIGALRTYFLDRLHEGCLDDVDRWIRMVAVNRLTGHSPGFFSVYTLPPNQAASTAAQRKINADRGQTPPRRDVRRLILRKSRALMADCSSGVRRTLEGVARASQLFTAPAASTPELAAGSVDLVVTSPPFLDVVNYAGDNWLRCWFCGIDPASVTLTVVRKLEAWRQEMTGAFTELARVLKPGGHVAFEVGEVRAGSLRLEEHVLPCGVAAGLEPVLVLINAQQFTKTAACWGVDNNAKGTNTNRIVLFRKP
jgi:hypothetical protein